MNLVKASAFLFTFSATASFSSPLSTQGEIDQAFANSQVILDAKIVSKTAIWTMGGELSSENAVQEIHQRIADFAARYKERFGADDDSPEARKYMEDWRKTDQGKKDSQPVDCLTLVTLFPQKVVKGNHDTMNQVIYASWTSWNSGILQTLTTDVSVDTESGSIVRLFLKPGWKNLQGIIPVGDKRLLIGTTTMEPTMDLKSARKTIVGNWAILKDEKQEKPKEIILQFNEGTAILLNHRKEVLRGRYEIKGKKDGMFRLLISDTKWVDSMKPKSSDDPLDDKDEDSIFILVTELNHKSLTLQVSDDEWSPHRSKVNPVRFKKIP